MIEKTPTIKPYNKKELAALYEVTRRTFTRQILPFMSIIGIKNGRFYNVKQVVKIFNCLGYPNSMLSDELIKKDELLKKIKYPED